jgi:hypothetical protein
MGLVDTLKDVVTLVQKTDNIELVKQVLALQSQALEMQEENRTLRERVKALEDALGFAKTLRFESPLYFAPEDKIPFCARCWEVDRRAIHLKGDWNGRRWECYQCGKVYLLDDTARPKAMFKSI